MAVTAALARKPLYYYGWNIVAACILSQIASLGVAINCFSLFLHGWSDEFHTPVSALALGITIFGIGCAVFAPLAGIAADKFPARFVMGAGLAAIAVLHFAVGLVGAGWQIIALYAVALPVGVTFSAAVPAQAVVSRWFVRRRGLAMGLTAFGIAAAGVVFPPIITWLLPTMGWRHTWWLFGALVGLAALPIVFLVLRDRPREEEGAAYVFVEEQHAARLNLALKDIFRRPNFWAVVGAFVPLQCATQAVTVNLAPLVMSRGLSLQTAGLLLSASSLAALVAKLGAGLLADRFGNRAPLVLLALLTAAGAVLLTLGQSILVLYAAMTLIGLTGGIWTLLASATAAEFGPQGFGRAYGVISAFTPIGTLAPPLLAWIYERQGSYTTGLIGLAVFALIIGGGSALLLRERRV